MDVARILIVEDNYETGDLLNLFLSQKGYCVIDVVATGEEAVDIAQTAQPDLILMDIKLKGYVDGMSACERIKKSANIPVIFISAYTDHSIIEQAMLLDPFRYVVKPFRFEQLLGIVEQALEQRELDVLTRGNVCSTKTCQTP